MEATEERAAVAWQWCPRRLGGLDIGLVMRSRLVSFGWSSLWMLESGMRRLGGYAGSAGDRRTGEEKSIASAEGRGHC